MQQVNHFSSDRQVEDEQLIHINDNGVKRGGFASYQPRQDHSRARGALDAGELLRLHDMVVLTDEPRKTKKIRLIDSDAKLPEYRKLPKPREKEEKETPRKNETIEGIPFKKRGKKCLMCDKCGKHRVKQNCFTFDIDDLSICICKNCVATEKYDRNAELKAKTKKAAAKKKAKKKAKPATKPKAPVTARNISQSDTLAIQAAHSFTVEGRPVVASYIAAVVRCSTFSDDQLNNPEAYSFG